MYCVNCGVKLADTEEKCPLCETVVYHPALTREKGKPLYPAEKMPRYSAGRKTLGGVVIGMFLIPLLVCLFTDLHINGKVVWSGYVMGALAVAYVALALPMWFQKPNPVIFVPCAFGAVAAYLLYIAYAVKGDWYLGVGFPAVTGLGVIVTAVVTLVHYVKKGKLYIFGGACILLGLYTLMMEIMICLTFSLPFIGWSSYPLIALVLVGGLLIYLAINRNAREMMERKLFF